jgi:hypothetical protein
MHFGKLVFGVTHALTFGLLLAITVSEVQPASASTGVTSQPACIGCEVSGYYQEQWGDWSAFCFAGSPFAPYWQNIFEIYEFHCLNGISFACQNTAPGPCAPEGGSEPGCPSGTCAITSSGTS